MSRDKAIEKINTEMQQKPDDPYMEIIGHYIIACGCGDPAAAARVMDGQKTLAKAMAHVREAARKKMAGGVGILSDHDGFDAVDEYFGFKRNLAARNEVKRQVDGGPDSAGPPPIPASAAGIPPMPLQPAAQISAAGPQPMPASAAGIPPMPLRPAAQISPAGLQPMPASSAGPQPIQSPATAQSSAPAVQAPPASAPANFLNISVDDLF